MGEVSCRSWIEKEESCPINWILDVRERAAGVTERTFISSDGAGASRTLCEYQQHREWDPAWRLVSRKESYGYGSIEVSTDPASHGEASLPRATSPRSRPR